MNRGLHLAIARAAFQRGILDLVRLSEALVLLGAAGDPPADFWTTRGGLSPTQLRQVLSSLQRETTGSKPDDTMPSIRMPGSSSQQAAVEAERKTTPLDRYSSLRTLGAGGMGEVKECRDEQLGRRVAIKGLRAELRADPSAALNLEREARVTGGLEHPNIIPVYDLGWNPDGTPHYIMRLIEQPTLGDVLSRLREDPSAASEYSLGRLLRYFIQVCNAVDYAHSRGVVHCDLKPANIILGSFGEVMVVDWGTAFRVNEQSGFSGGTPGYMAPEQFDSRHPRIDGRTDVFGLGATLYEVICQEFAFAQVNVQQVIAALADGRPPLSRPALPSERVPELALPREIEEIAMRALELAPEDRFPSARAMGEAIERFLEGTREKERRARRGAELLTEAEQLAANHREFLETRPEHLAEVAGLRASTPAWAPIDDKTLLWEAEDRVEVMDTMAVRLLQAAVTCYEQALEEVPALAGARQGLARLYHSERQRAHDRGDEVSRVYFDGLVRQFDDGTIAGQMGAGGRLSLRCEGEVVLAPYLERNRRLELGPEVSLRAPFEGQPLQPGSYLVVVRANSTVVRHPVLVRAGQEQTLSIDLSIAATAAPGEIFVPGGVAILAGTNGNPEAPELEPVEVPPFFIAARPVGFAEYLDFIEAMYAEDSRLGDLHLPHREDGTPYWRFVEGRFEPALVREWGSDEGELLRLPVFGVSADSAAAYAAWRGTKTGLPYRLPYDDEWEKAARGVDGREYPWGRHFDSSFCKMRQSHEGLPRPAPSGLFDVDVSPYGVRDLGGGVADWTVSRGAQVGARYVLSRGGSWPDWRQDCRIGAYRSYLAVERSARVGFRLARDAVTAPAS